MTALVGIYLILLVVYRPYHSVFHNSVLVVNQIGVLAAFVWLLLQNIILLTREI